MKKHVALGHHSETSPGYSSRQVQFLGRILRGHLRERCYGPTSRDIDRSASIDPSLFRVICAGTSMLIANSDSRRLFAPTRNTFSDPKDANRYAIEQFEALDREGSEVFSVWAAKYSGQWCDQVTVNTRALLRSEFDKIATPSDLEMFCAATQNFYNADNNALNNLFAIQPRELVRNIS